MHAPIITFRDSFVNTNRAGLTSQRVKNPDMDFSSRLKIYRQRAGLTQEQLALACGWQGQSRIANYEAARDKKSAREPALSELPVIAKALSVSVAELLGLPDVPQLSAEERRLLEIYRAATEESRRHLEHTAEMIERAAAVQRHGPSKAAS